MSRDFYSYKNEQLLDNSLSRSITAKVDTKIGAPVFGTQCIVYLQPTNVTALIEIHGVVVE